MKKIWILWGMWPQASLHFYEMLIKKTKNILPSPRNQDYPHIILSNIPVPDLIQWQDNVNITVNMVKNEAKCLEKIGVDILLMPCNTMHLFQEQIMQWINIPFISIIECVVSKIKKSWIKKIWLLWSSTTMTSSLYSSPLKKLWIKIIIPKVTDHEQISNIIKKYISGSLTQWDIVVMDQHCKMLTQNWAEGIILWCTELPLIMNNLIEKYKLFSSSEILADSILEYYFET